MTTETPNETTRPAAADLAGKTFSRRGFKSSEQVEAEGLAAGETPPETDTAAAEAANEAETAQTLPEEFSFNSEDGTPVTEPETETAPDTAAPAEDEIRIGDKSFTNQKEAWAYAAELERQNLVNDAFRQGIEAASNNVNSNYSQAVQAAPVEEKIPDEFYTDPAKFFKARERQMTEQVQAAIDARVNQINSHQKTMDKFWGEYPDLARSASTRALTERHLAQNFQALSRVETDKALKIIADKARAELKDLGVTILPSKVLPSNTKPAASVGTGTTFARPKIDDKPLNWVAQMQKMKAKRFTGRKG